MGYHNHPYSVMTFFYVSHEIMDQTNRQTVYVGQIEFHVRD